MTLASVIIFLLACAGAAHVATESKIGTPIRFLGYLLGKWPGYFVTCPPCAAFWIGAALCGLGAGPAGRSGAIVTIGEAGFFAVELVSYCLAAVAINRILFGFSNGEEEDAESNNE